MGDKSSVKVTFLGDAQALAAAAKKAQGSLDNVGKSVGAAARAGSFLGTAAGNLASTGLSAIKNFAMGSVDAFSAVEDATGAAGVQFGESLPSVLKFAEEAAKSFGLSKRQALEAQNTFGTLGKVAGLTGSDLAGFSQKLTGLAGDLASFKGTSTEQAIGAVGAALRGEAEPIRAYGVMLDDATLKAQALADGLLKPTVNATKVTAAAIAVTDKTRLLALAIKEHGKNSIEAAKAESNLAMARGRLDSASAGKIGNLTAEQKVMAAQAAIIKQTTDATGDYARTSTSTANTQKTLAAEAENAQAELGQKLAPAVTYLRRSAIKLIGGLSGLGSALAATKGFVESNATTFKALAAVVGVIMLPTLVKLTIQYARTAGAAVASAARQAAAWLVAQAGAMLAAAVYATVFAFMIAQWIKAGFQAMASAVRMAAAWLVAMGPIALVIAAVVAVTVLIIKNWDTVKQVTVAVFRAVWGAIKGAFDWVKSHWPLLLAILTGPIGLAVLFITRHWDQIVSVVTALPGRIRKAASGMWDGIKDAFKAAINWIIRGWNKLHFKMPSIDTHIPGVGKVGGFDLGLPQIPQLAKGGIVKARPGGTLVNVGEGGRDEAVVPLGRGGGASGQVVVQLVMDRRVIHTELLRLQNELGGSLGFK